MPQWQIPPLSPLDSALTESVPVTPLESALTENTRGVGVSRSRISFWEEHEGGKSAAHPPKRSTRRSGGLGWRWSVDLLRITATGRNLCAERSRSGARSVFRKMTFEISPHLHALPKDLTALSFAVAGETTSLTAGRLPTPRQRIYLIPLRLRDRRTSPRCIKTE